MTAEWVERGSEACTVGVAARLPREGKKGQQGGNRDHQISSTRDPFTPTQCASHLGARLAHRLSQVEAFGAPGA